MMPTVPGTPQPFANASRSLSRFVEIQAKAIAEVVGFTWVADHEAPMDYAALRRAYHQSQVSGQALPVPGGHVEPVIFTSPDTTLAFRFWHDLTHIRLDQGFDLDGEMEVLVTHLDVLRAAGFKPNSLEFELLAADTINHDHLIGASESLTARGRACVVRASTPSSTALNLRASLTDGP